MAYNIMETIKLHDLLPILDGVSDAVFIDDGAGHCGATPPARNSTRSLPPALAENM